MIEVGGGRVMLEHVSVKLPVRVVMVSTCSAAWPIIVDADVVEGDDGEPEIEEAIMQFNTAYVIKERYRGKAHNYTDHPKSFKLDPDGGKASLELAEAMCVLINTHFM